MEIKEFIEDLERSHFSLSVDNGKLLLRGDKKKLSKEEIAAIKKNEVVINFIKERKEEIIEFLSNSLEKPSETKTNNIASVYRLSGLQEGMLFHGLYDEKAGGYIEQLSCTLTGISVDAFVKSWENVIQHHSILRSAFFYDKFSVPVQTVYRKVDLPVEVLDYRHLDHEEQLAAIEQYGKEDANKSFDFKTAPLMRISLLRTGKDQYRMFWTSHHILFDGWSRQVLMEEFLNTYELLLAGKELPLAEEDRYEDYIRYIERIDKAQEEQYWRNYLKGLEQGTLLPFIASTSERTKGAGTYRSLSLQIDVTATVRIQNFAQRNRVTVNTVMQGAWSYLLHKYTGNDNIAYGVVVSGRPDSLANVEKRVGLYINTLPLHSRLQEEQKVSDWLQALQAEQVSSRQYEHTRLQQIQQWSEVQGDLFDSLMVFENYPLSKLLTSKQWSFGVDDVQIREQTNYPLNISINSAEQISIHFTYNTSLLKDEYVQEIRDHFEHVLLQMTERADVALKNIKLLTKAEENRLLVEFNDTYADYPKDKTIVDLFEEQAAKTPENVALVFDERHVTYKELDERSNQLAHYLKDKGVTAETLVPICIERSIEMVVGILGILKAGGAYVPIDPEYPEERIRYMLEDTGANLLVSSKELASAMPQTNNLQVVCVEASLNSSSEKISNHFSFDKVVCIIYTSGSSGKPKGVRLTSAGLTNRMYWMWKELPFEANEKIAIKTSIGFVDHIWELFGALNSGITSVLFRKEELTDFDILIKKLAAEKITRWVLVPSLLKALLNKLQSDNIYLQHLKYWTCSGEALSGSLTEAFYEVFPASAHQLINIYGSSEVTADVTWYNTKHELGINDQERNIPIGKPIANCKVYVLGKNNELLPVGVTGEICAAGVQVAKGYLNLPKLTSEKFIADTFSTESGATIYRTGDLGRWLPDGNIEYLGRIDGQLKIRGYRIEPGEIEQTLLSSGLVRDVVVTVKEDTEGNGRLVAYVVATKEFNRETIKAFISSRLPEYMVPAIWVELESLPLTPNGKIDKKALPEVDVTEILSNAYVAPGNEVEEKLAQIWKELLQVERVGVYDNFFELGGHSLLAIRLVSAIRKQLQLEVALKDVFVHRDIASLTQFLATKMQGEVLPIIGTQVKPEKIPLSFSQERLWFVDRLQGSVQYNMPVVLRIKGDLNEEALSAAFKKIIDRHEVFRTVFLDDNGNAYQKLRSENDWTLGIIDLKAESPNKEELQQQIQHLINQSFDFSTDFLIRADLIKLEDRENVLVFVVHHIVSDAWSNNIIVEELSKFYKSLTQKREPVLKPLTIQYADYAIWQRQHLQGEVLEKKLNYWKDKLADVVPLQLPSDISRPNVSTNNGSVIRFSIEKELTDKLLNLSAKHNSTLYTTLFTAFNILLYRYSGQDDLCIGTSVAGRTQHEVERLVGLFVNMLALRNKLDPGSSFSDLLEQVKITTLEAFEHQDVPFEKVVEAVVKERVLSRNPLVQVMFVLLNTPSASQIQFKDLVFVPETYEHTKTLFDITFLLAETRSGLQGTVQYSSDLYSGEMITGMVAHFKELLLAIIKSPYEKISTLRILTDGDFSKILLDFNDNNFNYPKDRNLIELFKEQVKRLPGKVAVVFGNEQITYKELDERSNSLVSYLLKQGIRQGDNIGLLSYRSIDMIVAILGILKTGGAYVPLNTDYPADRLKFILEDASVKNVVFTSEKALQLCPFDEFNFIDISGSSNDLTNYIEVGSHIESPAYVMYTSGTTGKPKGILVSQRNVIKLVFEPKEITVSEDDHVIQWSNYAFDGSVYEIFSSLLKGASLYLIKDSAASDVYELARVIEEKKITVFFVTTALFNTIVDVKPEVLRGLRKLLFGGEMVSAIHVKKALDIIGENKIVHVYGPTETTVYATYYPVKTIKKATNIPIGKPLSNTKILILDKHLQLVPVNVPGEIHIGGDGLSLGYLNNELLKEERFIGSPFTEVTGPVIYKTGDIGSWSKDGDIEYLGRVDDQVKIRGYRIELGEIENILLSHYSIRKAIVLVKEDKLGYKQLVAYVVADDWYNRDEVKSFLEQQLPEYMVPELWVELDFMPLNSNGKVDKKLLPEPSALEQDTNSFVAPRNELEITLAEIWQEFLEVEQVSVKDNFFELGGHSLLAIRVVSSIRKTLGVELEINYLFEYPTIAELADHISANKKGKSLPGIETGNRPENIPLSFNQERLWFLDQLEGSLQYHVPILFTIKGNLNIDALSNALNNIISRHEVLRTAFILDNGKPYQSIKREDDWQLSIIEVRQYKTNPQGLQQYLQQLVNRPFDLSNDYMLRGDLIKLDDELYTLLVTLHHIASDAWSMPIIAEEFIKLYTAFANPSSVSLAPLPVQYADYAIWQKKYLQGDLLNAKLDYWHNKLKNFQALQLPTDYPRPNAAGIQGLTIPFTIDRDLSAELQELSRQQNSTIFITMVTALNVLLHRYSGQNDICIGSPVSNRTQPGIESLIGFFVNTLTFRNELSADLPFNQLLQEVRKTILEGYENADVPFEKVVERIVTKRDTSRNPLFEVMFVLNAATKNEEISLGDVQLKVEPFTYETSKFDLTFFITETPNGLKGAIEYSTNLYKSETIERMIAHFKQLLASVVRTPQKEIGLLPMLSVAEEQKLLVEFNDTKTAYPREKSLVDLFEEQSAKTPDAVAVVMQDQQLSYKELNQKSNQLAYYLQSKGVKDETPVPVCIERSLEMIVGVLGILKAGGTYVPIDPDYPDERIQYMLQDTAAGVVVSSNESRAKLLTTNDIDIIELDGASKEVISGYPVHNLPTRVPSSNLVYIIYTSGSTGKPKGVRMPASGMVNLLSWQQKQFENKNRRVLQFASLNFDVSFQEIFSTLCFGSTLYLISAERRKDVFNILEDINSYGITHLFIPYIVLKSLSEYIHEFSPDRISLEEIIVAGEQLKLTEDVNNLLKKLTVKLVNQYGPTEAHVVSSYTVNPAAETSALPPIGKPVDNTELYILDSHRQLVPVGVPGELYIGGVQVAHGYLNLPELTAEKFVEDPFKKEAGSRLYRTGDLARWLGDGNIEYFGRIDDQVKIRGFRIELGEIESILQQSELIAQAVVLAKAGQEGNKRLVAYVVPKEVFDREAVVTYLKGKVPDYMVPAFWVEMESLPVTKNGKVDKRALPEPDISELVVTEYAAPQTETEEALVEIWQKLLGAERVGVNDNFFELGGHSLMVVRLVAAIKKQFLLSVPVATIFQFPTISELGNYLDWELNTLQEDSSSAFNVINL